MLRQWIDVIDTATKIGLGALISGGVAYATQKMNNNKITHSEAIKTEKELLLSIVSNFDKYIKVLNDFHANIDGVRIFAEKYDDLNWDDWDDLWEHIAKYDNKLNEEGENFTMASSRLRLLGLTKALESLEAIGEQENELRKFYNKISNNKAYPKEEYLLNWHIQFRNNRNRFSSIMAEHYRNLVNVKNK
ncbi:hypothetical protein L4C31_03755 [Aliivibrio sifiae]|uniref:hypothetical protein n=1 Tax=Aliivibrio fischeri TaxID=668 RepID=UPI0012DAAD77|nr:hypothetical protein [Aliivibrio fischeri]MUJ27928.1 hypothetical protein [Aliivibrio fischeri]